MSDVGGCEVEVEVGTVNGVLLVAVLASKSFVSMLETWLLANEAA